MHFKVHALVKGLLFTALLLGAGSVPGQLTRRPNSTLQLPATPPTFGFVTSNAFGTLRFSDPVALASPLGETNRLFVVEQAGRIIVITNLTQPNRTLFLDLSSVVQFGGEQGLLGLAFHPGYATNRYFYVFYTLYTNQAAGSSTRHDRLSRFQTSPGNPQQALANSELILINQRDQAGNHNGGDLHFGPDGYLYVSLGDEGGGDDSWNNSQLITKDFFAGILRIDVDQRPGSLPPNPHPAASANYAVPPDNPFVGATQFNGAAVNPAQVRTEFWAVGLRNPWRMSFDPATGRLYCGDVGQNRWEEVDVIVKGGNYGWAFREGLHAGPKSPPSGFSGLDPILEYGHGSGVNQGRSITGGVVYRGNRIPELSGHYVFADYVSGNIWSAFYDEDTPTPVPFVRLTGETGIAAFGVDPANGDILMADLNDDQIKRLVHTEVGGSPLPPTLADTGAFADLNALTPQAGIVAYDINVPFWSDNAVKQRWFSLPNLPTRMVFRPTLPWVFPAPTIWIKHFELELTNGVPASRRRLETRFLVRSSSIYGATYRWDDTQTNAFLVPNAGLDETLVIDDGGGLLRTQVWHYPSRTECLACHTLDVNVALGFNTAQLNRAHAYGGLVTNQLAALANAGYFFNTLPPVNSLRALAPLADEAHSVEQRVRSWLDANCAQCHRSGSFDARIHTPLSATQLVRGEPNNDLGDTNNRIVQPGALEHSLLLTRILTNGPLRMPPVASSVIDTQAVALLSRWITNDLPGYQSFADWQRVFFNSTTAPAAQAEADADQDRAKNWQEYLTGTNPTNRNDAWGIRAERNGRQVDIVFPRKANRGFTVEWTTNLFDSAGWQFLDAPPNRPFFSAADGETRVPDGLTNGPAKYYRVRVYEP